MTSRQPSPSFWIEGAVLRRALSGWAEMFIRCHSCRGVTWVEGDCRQQAVIDCSNCSRPLHLRTLTTQDTRTRFEDAVSFAEASEIDLPSANSVLLGVMTLREALSIQGKSTPVPKGAPSPMELAADEAMRNLERGRTARALAATAKTPSGTDGRQSRAALFAALGMLAASVALSAAAWRNWSEEVASAQAMANRPAPRDSVPRPSEAAPDRQQDRTRPAARVRRDRDEQVVQIIGRTPEAVLRAFCEGTVEPGRYEPVELTSTEPHRIGARVGVLRDYRDLAQSYAIWIQQRRKDRRWVAGNGREPLKPFALDLDRVGSVRIKVSADDPRGSG